MTKEEIAADRAVCDAATAGPWTTKPILGFPDWGKVYAEKDGPFQLLSINLAALGDVEAFRESHEYGTSEYDRGPELAAATADFIAAARTRWPAALDEIERLEVAIRRHRDERGDDRCWMDDERLYAELPEGYTPPARDTTVELENCRRFIECRHNPTTEYVSPQRRIEQLEQENAALRAQVNGHAERIAAQSELLSRKAEK